MTENTYEFLYQAVAIVVFLIASILFLFIIHSQSQMKKAFENIYKTQGMVIEGIEDPWIQADSVSGAELIFSIYYGLECPITIDEMQISEDVEISQLNLSKIDTSKAYRKRYLIDNEGQIIKIIYN